MKRLILAWARRRSYLLRRARHAPITTSVRWSYGDSRSAHDGPGPPLGHRLERCSTGSDQDLGRRLGAARKVPSQEMVRLTGASDRCAFAGLPGETALGSATHFSTKFAAALHLIAGAPRP